MRDMPIVSSDNAKFKSWLTLHDPRQIKKHGRFLLSGAKLVAETMSAAADWVIEILVPSKSDFTAWSKRGLPVHTLGNELFGQLDQFGTNHPILVCKTPPIELWSPDNKGISLLVPLGDPGNLGTLMRTSAALAVDQFVLLKESCNPFHPKCIRAASGAIFNMNLQEGPSIHKLNNFQGLCLDTQGQDINSFDWPRNVLLLVGEEGPGIPEQLNWSKLNIQQNPNTESLNATVAASLALFSYRQQHHQK